MIDGIMIPDSNSNCAAWKIYYKNLDKRFSRNRSNEIFLLTWQYNGSTSCTTDADFNEYFAKKGMNLPGALAGALASYKKTAGGMFNTLANVTTFTLYAIPIIAGGALLIILYYLFNLAKKGDPNTLLAITPAGRGAMAMKSLNS